MNEFRFGFVRINNQYVNTPIVTTDDLGIERPNTNVDNLIYKFTLNSSRFSNRADPGRQHYGRPEQLHPPQHHQLVEREAPGAIRR